MNRVYAIIPVQSPAGNEGLGPLLRQRPVTSGIVTRNYEHHPKHI